MTFPNVSVGSDNPVLVVGSKRVIFEVESVPQKKKVASQLTTSFFSNRVWTWICLDVSIKSEHKLPEAKEIPK